MYEDAPTEVTAGSIVQAAACPASTRGRRLPGPDASLERWKALNGAIVQWASERPDPNVERIERDLFGSFDQAQQRILRRWLASAREVIGDAVLDDAPPAARVFSDDGSVVLRQAITYELTHPEGDRELLRLKIGNPSSAEETAVLVAGTDADAHLGDLLAEPGQVSEIDRDTEAADEAIEQLFRQYAADEPGDPVPGFHCWLCDRAAVCGVYPNPWGDDLPRGRRIRSVKVSRSTLSRLGQCERRVAWKAIHQMPAAEDDRPDAPGIGRSRGSVFHNAAEMAILDGDPAGVIAAHAAALPASEQDDLHLLWERHEDLCASEPHPVTMTATELPFGVTIPVAESETVVVAIGTIDAAGREADGTAAVVEHRTGSRAEIPHLEQELYAVAASQTARVDRVAVHHHFLRADGDEACTRRVFEAADLEAALKDLRDAAETIAGWSPTDSLEAEYTVGDWCRLCPYEGLCKEWRA